jgi:hypothetical protein
MEVHKVKLDEEQLKELKELQELWCDCESESDPLYHEDGITPFNSCVVKHHYHCGWCLGLTQIG